jgi:hypothetical protein
MVVRYLTQSALLKWYSYFCVLICEMGSSSSANCMLNAIQQWSPTRARFLLRLTTKKPSKSATSGGLSLSASTVSSKGVAAIFAENVQFYYPITQCIFCSVAVAHLGGGFREVAHFQGGVMCIRVHSYHN